MDPLRSPEIDSRKWPHGQAKVSARTSPAMEKHVLQLSESALLPPKASGGDRRADADRQIKTGFRQNPSGRRAHRTKKVRSLCRNYYPGKHFIMAFRENREPKKGGKDIIIIT